MFIMDKNDHRDVNVKKCVDLCQHGTTNGKECSMFQEKNVIDVDGKWTKDANASVQKMANR